MPLFHILASLVIADVAVAVLIFTLSTQEPSYERVATKYLKEVTTSRVFPFMVVFALMLFMLFTITFYFSVLTSIPLASALSSSLLVRAWSSLLLPQP